ncbi:UNVERIFIED_CONTAM: hypothetical protein GTU68_029831 [Idotea baltica]|nr:hypothetical protein [Idotea baltica]
MQLMLELRESRRLLKR